MFRWFTVKFEHSSLAGGENRGWCIRVCETSVKPGPIWGDTVDVDVEFQKLSLTENTRHSATQGAVTAIPNNYHMASNLATNPAHGFVGRYTVSSGVANVAIK